MGESVALFLSLFPAVWGYCRSKTNTKLNLCDRNGIIETMISKFEGKQKEKLYVLCLDAKDAKFDVIAMDALFEGKSGAVEVSWEKLVRYVVINNVSSIALVYNHPNGVPVPSSNDVFFTRELISILKPLNVRIENHIIISGTKYISMREMEFLDDT
ncbi:MAG: JAB domain-containing protein [Oscillospiraceae bacterium]